MVCGGYGTWWPVVVENGSSGENVYTWWAENFSIPGKWHAPAEQHLHTIKLALRRIYQSL